MKSKTRQIARSIFSGHKYQVETPRCKMACSHCEEEVEKLTPVAIVDGKTLFLCDECRKGAK